MKPFHCRCGQRVWFDNHRCVACGRALAFDVGTLTLLAEDAPGSGLAFCGNRASVSHCNWLAGASGPAENGATDAEQGFCLSCRLSKIIPDLSKPENHLRWQRLEAAKRRLIVDLLSLGLDVDEQRLHFVFKEDRRTNPDVHDDHVVTGHADGVITINAAEADEVYREQMRQQFDEPVRTLLGHFRHESGHYYFEEVVTADLVNDARALFGDEREAYTPALERYYQDGPPPDWRGRFISGYASAHPAEDWAECWSHYLQMMAALAAAEDAGLVASPGDEWQNDFVALALGLNDVARALGLPDVYPFIVSEVVARKIGFVHRAVGAFRDRRGARSSPAA